MFSRQELEKIAINIAGQKKIYVDGMMIFRQQTTEVEWNPDIENILPMMDDNIMKDDEEHKKTSLDLAYFDEALSKTMKLHENLSNHATLAKWATKINSAITETGILGLIANTGLGSKNLIMSQQSRSKIGNSSLKNRFESVNPKVSKSKKPQNLSYSI